MKFPLAGRPFSQGLTASQPYAAATTAALSTVNLEPAAYSLPEPSAASPGGKSATLPPPVDAVALVLTSLPGCAARPSMDVLTDVKLRRTAEGASVQCCQPDCRSAPRDVDAVQDAVGAAAVMPAPRQQPLKASPPSPPPKATAPRRSLHYDRDANRARRNYRPSIDAAEGALTLGTLTVSESLLTAAAAEGQGLQLAAAHEVPGCVGADMPGCVPPAPKPFAQLPPPPAPPRAAAAAATVAAGAPLTEWSFGDNLQRARMLARYAAMAAAAELRYEPRGGGAGDDSDEGGGSAASRRSRTWKLLSSLLTSSKGGGGKAAAAAATASIVERWQEATAAREAAGRRCDGAAAGGPAPVGGGGCGSRRSVADDESPVVVRSRDSRRLMRVQRSRVGIDREGQTQKQKQPGRASAPAFTQQRPQQQDARQPHPRSSAPALLTWDGREMEEEDEVNAAVIAAAAEFAAAVTTAP